MNASSSVPPPTFNAAGDSGRPVRVLAFTTLFPNRAQPRLGIFVRNRVTALAQHYPTVVVAPVLQRMPGKRLDEDTVEAIPQCELQEQLQVYHPRFTTLPGIGRCADASLLFWQTIACVRRLRRSFPFDLIDAHYAYPDGAAALLLAQRFGVPISITVRGGDLDLLTRFRMRRRVIRRTLAAADVVIAVSEHLASQAIVFGADPKRVRVVMNGTEPDVFFFTEQRTARRELDIAPEAVVLVCVANLIPEKGQHVLIAALSHLRSVAGRRSQLMIIGSDQRGDDSYRQQLNRQIVELGLSGRVHFLGSKAQPSLRDWYCAADMVILPTFREGCPNVIREALACGTPVVASRVGGVAEVVPSERFGVLVEAGNPTALATAIDSVLERRWDRPAIAAATKRTWADAALEVRDEFARLMCGPADRPISAAARSVSECRG